MEGFQLMSSVLAMAAVLEAVGSSYSQTMAFASPEAGVTLVLQASRERSLEQAARYFRAGAIAYRRGPQLFTDYLDIITDHGAAVAFSVVAEEYDCGGATLYISTFADTEKTSPLSTTTWWFEHRPEGWVVVGVR